MSESNNGHGSKTEPTNQFQFFSPLEIEALPELEWLVEGILPQPAFAVLYGEPGCGKTFVALSMALTIANGEPWVDLKTVQKSILYVAAEGVLGLKTRIKAFRQEKCLIDDHVQFIAEPFNISDEKEVESLLSALEKINFKPGLIVVDTLARVALGVDENNAKDMGKVVAGFDNLKRHTGATILVIHHTRKDGGSERGSSALRGAADVMIACSSKTASDSFAVTLKCMKMKDDEPFKDFAVRLEKVKLPENKSSLVVTGLCDLSVDFGANEDKIVQILEKHFSKSGVTHGALKKVFVDQTGTSDSTFNRAWAKLKGSDRIQQKKVKNRVLFFPVSVSAKPVSK